MLKAECTKVNTAEKSPNQAKSTKCLFQAYLLDMATFKSFFLVYRDSGLEHAHHSDFYGASAECTNHGGAIAFPPTDEHMAELVRLLAESDDAQESVTHSEI